MTALQWIVKEAKAIKKKYPKRFSTWKEYVSQASAIYASKHKGKTPVGKKHKKSIGKVKKSAKKKSVKSYHKDTKSHNVNIRVMSGVGKNFKNYIAYKKHIIDVEILPNGKKCYWAHGGAITPPFCTNSLTTAKKFIDRVIYMEKNR